MAQTVVEEMALIIQAQDAGAMAAVEDLTDAINAATEALKQNADAAANHAKQSEQSTKSSLDDADSKIRQASALDRTYASYVKLAGAYAAAWMVARKGVQIYRELTQEGEQNVLAVAKLDAILVTTGRSAELTSGQVARWADGMRKSLGIAETEIMDMAGSLAVFGNIGADVLPKVLEQSANLSAVWGDSMAGSAKQLGRALDDPIRGMALLERSGISLTAQQKELITSLMDQGRVQEAQAVILDALEAKVGGLAAAMKTAKGPAGEMKLALGEMKGAIGEDLLRIPGLEAAVRSLDKYLVGRADRRDLADLFTANRDQSLDDLIKDMGVEDLEYHINLVAGSRSTDVAQTFRRSFEDSRASILKTLEAQKIVRAELETEAAKQAAIAKRNQESEDRRLASILAQQEATKALHALYVATDEGRIHALQEELQILAEQQKADEELIEQEATINYWGNEENLKRLAEAKQRTEYYSAVIAAKQEELDGLQKIEIAQDYLAALMGGVGASDYVMQIPVGFDFGRSEQEELEEQLSALKGQINKLWAAGPGEDDSGQWQEALDILAGKYNEIENAITAITVQETLQARARELLAELLSEEEVAQAKKLAYQEELQRLEDAGLITAEQRADLWNKEYSVMTSIKTVGEHLTDEFIAMGEALEKQFFSADALGKQFSSMMIDFGTALSSGTDGLDALGESTNAFVQSIMGQISQMAIASGLRVIAETGWAGVPVALGLFALGGVAGMGAGLLGGSGRGLDKTLMGAMQEETKARQKLAESINKTIDTEYDLLRRQLDRNLITADEFRAEAGAMQKDRDFADARAALSSAASSEIGSISGELESMSGWTKFWTQKDEKLEARAKSIQKLFDAIDGVTDADQLRSIQSQLEKLGVKTGNIPKFAAGGEFMTSGPQLIQVGDNPGGVEHVKITPVSSAAGSAAPSPMVVNVYGPVLDYEDLYRKLQQAGAKVQRKKIG